MAHAADKVPTYVVPPPHELEREPLTDPIGPDTGDFYVIRGSNYTNGRFSELRWTFRDYGSEPRSDVGFRIARYVE